MKREVQIQELHSELSMRYRECVEAVMADLTLKGLLGKHDITIPILENSTTGGLIGEISGNLFSMRGNLYGEVGDQPAFTFNWITNTPRQRMVLSRIQGNKLVMEAADEEIEKSNVEFIPNLKHFIRINETPLTQGKADGALTTIQYPHPNDYLQPDALTEARIQLSTEDFQRLQAHDFKR